MKARECYIQGPVETEVQSQEDQVWRLSWNQANNEGNPCEKIGGIGEEIFFICSVYVIELLHT